MKLLVESPGKFLSKIWKFVTKTRSNFFYILLILHNLQITWLFIGKYFYITFC